MSIAEKNVAYMWKAELDSNFDKSKVNLDQTDFIKQLAVSQ